MLEYIVGFVIIAAALGIVGQRIYARATGKKAAGSCPGCCSGCSSSDDCGDQMYKNTAALSSTGASTTGTSGVAPTRDA